MTFYVGDPGDHARAKREQPTDGHRVDPAGHRGEDIGILHLRFRLPLERRDDDPAGPRRLPPEPRR
jgi:hypothetical protein